LAKPRIAPRFDPQRLPVQRVDAHLPPVAPARLSAAALRQRFASPPDWQPELHAERRFVDRPPAHASVLVPIVGLNEPTVLLTQRTLDLADHPGQISFPGGRAEDEDTDAVATALREAHEEVGLPHEAVEVLGTLPHYVTGTGFIVTPVIGLVADLPTLTPDPGEVAEVFQVPLHFLMSPAHHRHHAITLDDGIAREFLSMPWPAVPEGADVPPGTRYIWGATAGMLRNLYRFLAA
jgi:8-oxo-dGTP pyrophosphatase MutT (NUDIX family)